MPLGVLPVPGLRGGLRAGRRRARRWCSTPTAWSSGPASTSTPAWTGSPHAVRDAPDRSAAALRPRAARAGARAAARRRRRRAAHAAHDPDGATASASSCRPSRRRSPRCAPCCGAGCATSDGSEQEIAEVVTACGEAATNAIEHAGAGRPVRDQRACRRPPGGASRCATTAPGARRARATTAGGSRLMRALMDTVEVMPTPEGTTVRMERTLLGPTRTEVRC